MPRKHTRKSGSRRYDDCKADAISNALRAIKGGRTIRKAARDFDVPYGTLYNKMKGLHKSSYGAKRELPDAVEIDIVNILEFCAVMKAPIEGFDLRCIVQNLLNACNIKSKKFKRNMPGPDWLENFIKRHSLTKRIADNVKSARAEVTPDVIDEFLDNIQTSLDGVKPGDMFNYDETNLRDDPGKKLVISRRGRRQVERKTRT